MNGLFISFEGIDGSGKTTQVDRAAKWLTPIFKQYGFTDLVVTHEPGGTRWGHLMRSALLNSDSVCPIAELLAFASDRAQHVHQVIRPALDRGELVLCDRFTASTFAYQGYGRGLPLNQVCSSIYLATNGLQPDLTIWLDVPVEKAIARHKSADRIEFEPIGFYRRVVAGYERLDVTRVDGDRNPDEVFYEVQQIIKLAIRKRTGVCKIH